jgi:Tfp pilus assembly protein PilV
MITYRSKAGFTLLEALLALFVFSVAVIALVETINTMGVASTEARQQREIVARIESLMLEATRKQPAQPTPDQQKGFDRTVKEGGVSYHLKMSPMELKNQDDQPLDGLFQLKTTASWKDGGQEQQMTVETWVYPPLFAPTNP